MASMKDAGVSTGGNFIAPKLVLDQGYIFAIVGAEYREAHGEFKEQVEISVRFYDADRVPAGEVYRFSMGYNDVRAKLISFFNDHPGEIIDGVDGSEGLAIALGGKAIKGNKPMIFRDADWETDQVFLPEDRNGITETPF